MDSVGPLCEYCGKEQAKTRVRHRLRQKGPNSLYKIITLWLCDSCYRLVILGKSKAQREEEAF